MIIYAFPLNKTTTEYQGIGGFVVGETLVKSGLKVDKIICDDKDGLLKNLGPEIVNVPGTRNHLRTLCDTLVKIATRDDVVIIHLHQYSFFRYLSELYDKIKCKFIIYHQGVPDLSAEISYHYKQDVINALRIPHIVNVFVSHSQLDRFFAQLAMTTKDFSSQFLVIYPGTDPSHYNITNLKYDISVVARVDKAKALMESVRYPTSLGKTVVHCGHEVPFRPDGYDKIYEEFHPPTLTKLGCLPHAEVFKQVYSKSKVNFLMSPKETFGLFVVEAAFCGVPSIVPDTSGGPIELITLLGFGSVISTHRLREKNIIENFSIAFDKQVSMSIKDRYDLASKAIEEFGISTTVGKFNRLVGSLRES
jgi:glycosyltransferase involved in cell wall biosynthesis